MSSVAYKLKRLPTENDKIAKTPQVKVILTHLQDVGIGHKIDREELAKRMDADPKFVTRQGALKILNFYIPRLVKDGLVDKLSEAPAAANDEPKAKGTGAAKEPKPAKRGEPKKASHEDEEDEGELAGEDGEE